MSDEGGVAHLESLLARLEAVRAQIDAAPDADAAVPLLAVLHELAQEVSAEVERQRRAAADEGDA